jgi:hypothetical protein
VEYAAALDLNDDDPSESAAFLAVGSVEKRSTVGFTIK